MEAVRKSGEGSPWMPFETRRRARDAKREAILRMALHLFLEEGYHRVPLSTVAERLNITKAALYNYFTSKEDILRELFRQGNDSYESGFADIEHAAGNGLEKLRAMIRAYVRVISDGFGMCIARLDDRELGDEARSEVRAAKRRFDSAFRARIADGIADGSIRPCDPKLAAFAIIGAINGVADWYRPEGSLAIDIIAEQFALLLTEGIATKRTAKPGTSGKKSTPKRSGARPKRSVTSQ